MVKCGLSSSRVGRGPGVRRYIGTLPELNKTGFTLAQKGLL